MTRGRLRIGRLELDARAGSASVGRVPLSLTRTQFRVLWALASELGRTVTREELLDAVWGRTVVLARTADVHVAQVRKKLQEHEGGALPHVETVWGAGYRLSPPAFPASSRPRATRRPPKS